MANQATGNSFRREAGGWDTVPPGEAWLRHFGEM